MFLIHSNLNLALVASYLIHTTPTDIIDVAVYYDRLLLHSTCSNMQVVMQAIASKCHPLFNQAARVLLFGSMLHILVMVYQVRFVKKLMQPV